MLSTHKRFIFIHIPKTGGNSIYNALREFSEDNIICRSPIQDGIDKFEVSHKTYLLSKHASLSDYSRELGANKLDEYLIFTCIRNPWERMISYFFSPHRMGKAWSRESFDNMLDNETKNAQHYLTKADNKPNELEPNIYYLRFESLQYDFDELCDRLSIARRKIPHNNVSNHQDYRKYYDTDLIQKVARMADFEIQKFDYRF